MPYMPMPDEATAMAVSSAIQRLSVPIGETRSTLYSLSWQTTPNGQVWMEWATQYPFPVAPGHGDELADILAAFVQAGQLTPTSAETITTLIETRLAAEGGGAAHVTLEEVTPPEWLAMLVSDEAFEAMYPLESLREK